MRAQIPFGALFFVFIPLSFAPTLALAPSGTARFIALSHLSPCGCSCSCADSSTTDVITRHQFHPFLCLVVLCEHPPITTLITFNLFFPHLVLVILVFLPTLLVLFFSCFSCSPTLPPREQGVPPLFPCPDHIRPCENFRCPSRSFAPCLTVEEVVRDCNEVSRIHYIGVLGVRCLLTPDTPGPARAWRSSST